MSDVDMRPDAAENTPESTETNENRSPDVTTPDENTDTFPRSYVEELRKESADHRTKAKAAEDQAGKLAKRLHTALVTATNRLENPADLTYDAEHLGDDGKLTAALDALLTDRPYLAKRAVKGDAGQGNRGGAESGMNLLDMLRGNR